MQNSLQKRFDELFKYEDGKLIRKVSVSSARAGTVVGSVENNGYIRVRVDTKKYSVHQVVFVLFHGYLPKIIDHVNGIKTDNRIENLREATSFENGYNTKLSVTSKSGVKNVRWLKKLDAWQVRLKVKSINKVIGYFKDLELAELVATMAREKYHGEFANHGVKA